MKEYDACNNRECEQHIENRNNKCSLFNDITGCDKWLKSSFDYKKKEIPSFATIKDLNITIDSWQGKNYQFISEKHKINETAISNIIHKINSYFFDLDKMPSLSLEKRPDKRICLAILNKKLQELKKRI